MVLGVFMMLAITAVWLTAVPAGAQESTVGENTAPSEDATVGGAVLPEVTTPVQREAQAEGSAQAEKSPVGEAGSLNASERQLLHGAAQDDASGDLAGKPVNEEDNNGNTIINRLTIDANGCRVDKGATIVVEDETGTIGVLVDSINATIDSTGEQVVVEGPDPSRENENIPFISRENLTGELTVLSSAGIDCEADDGGGNGGGGSGGGGGEPQPLPPDEEKGPLAGGTARGDDVLVKGDLGCGPTGNNPCIDQIVIQTENCELTEQGKDLTITVNDQGEPFRLIDGENVDITIQQDGTIVANGRKTLGPLATAFNGGERDNPTRRILPIPVKQGDTPGGSVNDTFPIISTTSIDGKGCRVVETSATNQNDPSTNQPDDGGERSQVITDTISDEPLPSTGGPPLLGLAVIALGLAVIGASVVGVGIRRDR
ncbi:MAG: hypothetical protein H0V21_09190 [Rubrobacter sp.]|nr:hypothetical protein [Rubrobacter sp.]